MSTSRSDTLSTDCWCNTLDSADTWSRSSRRLLELQPIGMRHHAGFERGQHLTGIALQETLGMGHILRIVAAPTHGPHKAPNNA